MKIKTVMIENRKLENYGRTSGSKREH